MAFRVLALSCCLLAGVPSAHTQTRDDNAIRCNSDDPGARIIACTALVQSEQLSPVDLAKALESRGTAYLANAETDRALQDLDRAITLAPTQ